MSKRSSVPFIAFLQATGLVVYIAVLSLFFTFVTPNFRKSNAEFYAPIIMLLLFVLSAVISATLVLGRSAVLFWEKKFKEAFKLLAWTIGWGTMYFLLFMW